MKVSVICPFFNESAILENALRHLIESLETLETPWELIVVNDGSTDNSYDLAKATVGDDLRVKVASYPFNQGRGYALRHGASLATGDILVTTEIDLSWGDDIVHRLINAFQLHPDADMIIASPNLPGGGYRNVPISRVRISRLGNQIIRMGQSRQITMYTGMTRAYRREAFLSLPIDENEKEFHLEVVQKAQAFGFRIYEIPCILEWRTQKLSKGKAKKRISSSRINKLVWTHMAFSLVTAPFRYILPASVLLALIATFFLGWAIYNLINHAVAIFALLTALGLYTIAFLTFITGILSYQGKLLQQDVWRLRWEIKKLAQRRNVDDSN